MENTGVRPTTVPRPTEQQIAQAQAAMIMIGLSVYGLVRLTAFAFERGGAGLRSVQRGMESAAKAMAENAARTQGKPSQA